MADIQHSASPPKIPATVPVSGHRADAEFDNAVNFDAEAPPQAVVPEENPDQVSIEDPAVRESGRPIRDPKRGEPRVEDPLADPANSGE